MPGSSSIYLDHAATTPLRHQAAAAVADGMARWANPSSPHAQGRAARAALENARARIAAGLGWEHELIFTGGASEAAVIALSRAKAGTRLVSAVEHESVLRAAPGAFVLGVTADGALDMAGLEAALQSTERPIVAVQTVNSETGNRQDIPAIAAVVHAAGGLLLVDAAQSAGKWPVPPEADMVIVSAHKLGGPPGIGALLVRDYALLEPSGGQEHGYRGGTENLPGALGFAAALEACDDPYLDPVVIAPVAQRLAPLVARYGGVRLSDRLADPTPYIEAIAMPGLAGATQLMRFDMGGIAVSQGSACSSGSLRQSHVLGAMGLDEDIASRVLRISFGWNTTRHEVDRFIDAWVEMVQDARVGAA